MIKKIFYTILAKPIANRLYNKKFGRNINWSNPTEFNEKLRVIQFNTNTDLWVILADKYRVREYLISKGQEHLLVDLYGCWDKAEEIDFDALPDSFVLKTNNGCGDAVIVKDKKKINKTKIINFFHLQLHSIFGLNSAQTHYSKIKGCVIAEEFLCDKDNPSNPLVDYKFYCFNGEPKICGVFYDRQPHTHITNCTFYDMKWNRMDSWKNNKLSINPSKDIPRPKLFNQMKQICRDLTAEFPFVRLDLYLVNDRIYFGEYTFTPAACDGGSLNPDIFDMLGSWITLN